MERYQNRQFDRTGHPVAADLLHGPANVRGAILSEYTGGVAAIDLVNQAAQVIQSIEDQAAETKMRAHDLARRAAEQLNFAERRVGSELAQSAAEASLNEANARADQAEQGTRIAQAQIADIEDRLCTAEDRAKNAEARAIEAEKTLIRVEEAIRSQLLAKRQPLTGISAVAA